MTIYLVISGNEPNRSISWVTTDGPTAEQVAKENYAVLVELRQVVDFGPAPEQPLPPAMTPALDTERGDQQERIEELYGESGPGSINGE